MLGWNITIYRQKTLFTESPTFETKKGIALATWQAGLWGLQWIDKLCKEGKGFNLGGCGYPCKYTAKVEDLRAQMILGIPDENKVWQFDPGDVLLPHYLGRTQIDFNEWDECEKDEWLIIVAWDES